MKRLFPILVLVAAAVAVALAFRPAMPVRGFDLEAFGRLPVLSNGRVKPVDTIARTTLLQLQGRQTVYLADGTQLTPSEWLLDIAFRPEVADTYRTFSIDDPDVLSLINKDEASLRITYESKAKSVMAILGFLPSRYRRFTYAEIVPYAQEIEKQARLADEVESNQRTRFQRNLLSLYNHLLVYQGIKYSFAMPGDTDYLGTLNSFQDKLPQAAVAAKNRKDGKEYDQDLLKAFSALESEFQAMADSGSLLVVPPIEGLGGAKWSKAGAGVLQAFETGAVHPVALTYAGIGYTWRANQPERFNEVVRLFRAQLNKTFADDLNKGDYEARFNAVAPFYQAMTLFIVAFLVGVGSWLRWPEALGRAAFGLVALAWVLTTLGIVSRMWIEGRPPVTNLYSSALFVGWGAVALCLVIEVFFRNAIGTVAAGLIGFCALIIAHHLSLTGDTMEMMRAVLDSNFWLATHVVTVTIGYAATFLAGFLAILYVVLSRIPDGLNKEMRDAFVRIVYGIVCFATLFSLVGTVLGGIWADQSWGRFWGWDPKENGALIIVIWNAVYLHARWGGIAKTDGLMALAVFGNVVTAWSWFGTNMLGVGLHTYGFMDAAFYWLIAFVVANLAVIALAMLPRKASQRG